MSMNVPAQTPPIDEGALIDTMLYASQCGDLATMNRVIRQMGGIERLDTVTNHSVQDSASVQALHLLNAWRMSASMGLSVEETTDTVLEDHSKVFARLDSVLFDSTKIQFLGRDPREKAYDIPGLCSVIFTVPTSLHGRFEQREDHGARPEQSQPCETDKPKRQSRQKVWEVHEHVIANMHSWATVDVMSDVLCISTIGTSCEPGCDAVIEVDASSAMVSGKLVEDCGGVMYWEDRSVCERAAKQVNQSNRTTQKDSPLRSLLAKRKPLQPAVDVAKLLWPVRAMDPAEKDPLSTDQLRHALERFLNSGWKIDDALPGLARGMNNFMSIEVSSGRLMAIELLAAMGANVDGECGSRGRAHIHQLISSSSPCGEEEESKLRTILRLNANVDREDKAGNTPLMLACAQGKPNMAKILIDAGANLHLRNHQGDSVAEIIARPPRGHQPQSCRPLIQAKLALEAMQDVIRKTTHSSADPRQDIRGLST